MTMSARSTGPAARRIQSQLLEMSKHSSDRAYFSPHTSGPVHYPIQARADEHSRVTMIATGESLCILDSLDQGLTRRMRVEA